MGERTRAGGGDLLPGTLDIVITSYSIHYTKLYENKVRPEVMVSDKDQNSFGGFG